ncbi:MAG: hypothetical protein NVS2B12_32770 [Ktedonobacteraceae bacterium]
MHTTRDLANILQLMQTSRQSGDLIVEPVVQNATPWQGLFRLVDGQITFCQVRGKIDRRVLLRDNEAMHWLINPSHGKLEWSLEESAPVQNTFLPLLSAGDDSGGSMNNTAPNPMVQSNMSGYATSSNPGMHNARNTQNTSPGTPIPDGAYSSGPWPASQYGQPGAIPKRTAIGNKAPSMVLSSRDLRQVFALIDGSRTVEEIARLLHKPHELVTQLLNELKANSLID